MLTLLYILLSIIFIIVSISFLIEWIISNYKKSRTARIFGIFLAICFSFFILKIFDKKNITEIYNNFK